MQITITSEMKRFLANDEIIDMINDNDFDSVYNEWNKVKGDRYISDLTKILCVSGIDILPKMSRIPPECFAYMSIKSIDIPNNIEDIDERAFFDCKKLTSINLSNSLRSIVAKTFFNCESLTNIIIPEGVLFIGREAFANSGLTSITIPSSCSVISQYAFLNCTSLRKITYIGTKDKFNRIFGHSDFYDEIKQNKIVIECSDGKINF